MTRGEKMPKISSKFVLAYDDVSLLVEFLYTQLKDKLFDFSYMLTEMSGKPILIPNQKLSAEMENPVRVEIRRRGKKRKEELVIFAEADDLLISVSEWRKPLFVDLGEKDSGIISISNADGDTYVFKIHEELNE